MTSKALYEMKPSFFRLPGGNNLVCKIDTLSLLRRQVAQEVNFTLDTVFEC